MSCTPLWSKVHVLLLELLISKLLLKWKFEVGAKLIRWVTPRSPSVGFPPLHLLFCEFDDLLLLSQGCTGRLLSSFTLHLPIGWLRAIFVLCLIGSLRRHHLPIERAVLACRASIMQVLPRTIFQIDIDLNVRLGLTTDCSRVQMCNPLWLHQSLFGLLTVAKQWRWCTSLSKRVNDTSQALRGCDWNLQPSRQLTALTTKQVALSQRLRLGHTGSLMCRLKVVLRNTLVG